MTKKYLIFVFYVDYSMCCECGTLIEPNPANMCVPCLRNKVDITEGIPKQAILYFCRSCERYCTFSLHLFNVFSASVIYICKLSLL